MDWKESLKAKAGGALAKVEATAKQEARVLMAELTRAGVTVKAEKGALKVAGVLSDDDRAKIKRLKSELLDHLQAEATVQWKPDDLAILCSLSPSGIVDFVIGPAVDGIGQPVVQEAVDGFLEAASPSWRLKVKECGGGVLKIYSLSQWEEAKQRFKGILEF